MPLQFMIDIESTELSKVEETVLKHPNTGAVILFSRNFINPQQLARLVNSIKEANSELFIAIDHEGGNVQRFQRHGFSALPAALTYGKIYDHNQQIGIELAQEYGTIMAQELLAHGIDLSLAPVLDIHGPCSIIAGLDRAFHVHPEAVTEIASAFIKGMNLAGMPAVGKHFPGHGSVLSDSHITMPIYDSSLEELETRDLKPFFALISQGLLAAIMPAHVTYTAVDKENPAGFSSIWLENILREQLGFQGLVLSDCLSMKGADIGDLATRADKALQAGCDMLIVSHQPRELLLELLQTTSLQKPGSLERILEFTRHLPQQGKNPIQAKQAENEAKKAGQYDVLNKTITV